jgi:hypothetical protein
MKIPALSLFISLSSNVSASMLNELMTMENWRYNLHWKMDIQKMLLTPSPPPPLKGVTFFRSSTD